MFVCIEYNSTADATEEDPFEDSWLEGDSDVQCVDSTAQPLTSSM